MPIEDDVEQYRRSGESGVYVIKNLNNYKCYVGSTYDISKRFQHHFNALRRGDNRCIALQHAWNKYGEDDFIAEVLEFCDPDDLIKREQFWIDALQAADSRFGYNSRKIADSNFGTQRSQETKDKIGAAHKGKMIKESTRRLISINNIERDSTQAWRKDLADRGLASVNQKLLLSDIEEIKRLKNLGLRNKDIGARFGVNGSTISRAVRGVTSYGPGIPRRERFTNAVDIDLEMQDE